jgi:hypothetical protein
MKFVEVSLKPDLETASDAEWDFLPSVALSASVSTGKGKIATNERTRILLIKE